MVTTQKNRVIVHRPGAALATSVVGVKGLRNLGGRIREEYDTKLQNWRTAVEIYLEMLDDITIGTAIDAINLPLLAADFDVTPHSESLPDLFAADFLHQNLERMHNQSWRNYVNDALSAVAFGWEASEIVLEKRDDGRLWLRNLAVRGQETLERWEFDDEDNVLAFLQRAPDTGEAAAIPIEKLVHITFRGRKGNPQGKALLREFYRNWRFIKELENLEGIGLERNVGGMPVFHLPENGVITDADLKNLKESGRNLRVDEEMYLILPNGLELESYASNSQSEKFAAVIDRKQKELLMRVFAQFLKLGMDNVGTQALVKGSQDFFALSLRAVQQELLEAWNQQLVPFLFRFNAGTFPGMTGLPTITWNDPGKVDLESFVTSYNTAVTAKLITPIREDEEHYRAVADMPDLPEGEGEGPRDVEQPGAGGPMFTIPFDAPSSGGESDGWDTEHHNPGTHDQRTHGTGGGGTFGAVAGRLDKSGGYDKAKSAKLRADLAKTTEGQSVLDAADTWAGTGSSEMRGEAQAWLEGGDDTTPGAVLAQTIGDSAPRDEQLYRGVFTNSIDESEGLFQAGSTHDLPPSSFTTDRSVADEFAGNRTPMVFEVEPGSRSLNMEALSEGEGFASERERISMGQYEITGTRRESINGQDGLVVEMRQKSVFVDPVAAPSAPSAPVAPSMPSTPSAPLTKKSIPKEIGAPIFPGSAIKVATPSRGVASVQLPSGEKMGVGDFLKAVKKGKIDLQ